MTQAEVAKKARLAPSAVSQFEGAVRAPSLENLRRLADALDVSVDYLMGRIAEMAARGPVVDRILRYLAVMTEADKAALEQMAAVFAQRAQGGQDTGSRGIASPHLSHG